MKSFSDEVIIGFSSSVWSYEEVLTQYGGYLVNSSDEQLLVMDLVVNY
jgi:hypothetical protein